MYINLIKFSPVRFSYFCTQKQPEVAEANRAKISAASTTSARSAEDPVPAVASGIP